jgi:hypothetical protein
MSAPKSLLAPKLCCSLSLSSRANSAKKPCAALMDANEGKKGKKEKKTQPPKRP